ncbi:MAG: carboxyl-terminal processing protease [Epulopiscium sp.]|mgnify:FL=1|jgi:carboxyl-terminal processing protease|uniref:PDZ domain-containing protein n=1 Tax=Defluviitalea raffinosedens TaxID=1450156 RepID=A0A7C8LDW9_9FIRM|nr:S41 family peptidase [Defluviitalea raffinosedens]MBZ4667505.1 family peptidase [Defluviitaleaceae bacterium]MDK2787357.1 carboxyl-terminal processing protease [Candidatus Epulonipiscium sp.]KAE9635501.1 PDZ domain-containing protein [Defluviitalea raffinosedens]MBM7684411.1 carboxyl-terminal processing protease [Defluviitalea raffinosedens]HHW68482.1 S41 family peptidase [Candidatus Epulonipiscium sp.]
MKDKKSFLSGLAVGMSIVIFVNIVFIGFRIAMGMTGHSNLGMNQKVNKILAYLNRFYVDKIDEVALEEGMYKGLVAGVGDPYTTYMSKEEFEDFQTETTGRYAGIGVVVSVDQTDQLITVVSPFEGSPGAEAGLIPGDKIIKVNDFEVTGDDLNEAVSMMKGPAGTKVKLTVYRKSEFKTFDVEITRANIDYPTVSHKMLDGNIGYIKIVSFDEVTYDQFMTAYKDLTSKGQKGLIIDLRNNPGGLLSIVTKIADQLLPEGMIVYTEDKNGKKDTYLSDANEIKVPLVILVNQNSASASEILSGAVKDHNKGKLVGTTTFGKGLVQSIYPLGDGSAIKITISKYYTPSGVCIQGIGIEPDYVVELPDDLKSKLTLDEKEDIQLKKALEVIKEQL